MTLISYCLGVLLLATTAQAITTSDTQLMLTWDKGNPALKMELNLSGFWLPAEIPLPLMDASLGTYTYTMPTGLDPLATDRWVCVRGRVKDAAGVFSDYGAVACNQVKGGSIIVPPPPLDTDGDGVPDATDQCPTIQGPVTNFGCPVVIPPPAEEFTALTNSHGVLTFKYDPKVCTSRNAVSMSTSALQPDGTRIVTLKCAKKLAAKKAATVPKKKHK